MTPIPPLAVSVDGAARLLNVSTDTLRREIAVGRIPARRMRGRLLIVVAELEAAIAKYPATFKAVTTREDGTASLEHARALREKARSR